MKVELHHWEPCGDSLKLLVCLNEKKIEFKSHYLDVMQFRQYESDYLKLAPLGQVPILVHDGTVLNEPRLLLEYCEDAFPGPALAPREAAGWYDTQEWIRYGDAQLREAVNLLGWHTHVLPRFSRNEREEMDRRLAGVPVREKQAGWSAVVRDAESTEDKLENARGRIREAAARIEKTLGESEWLVGRAYSIADISIFAMARTLPGLLPEDVNRKVTPNTCAWLDRIAARPAASKALAIGRDPSAPVYVPV